MLLTARISLSQDNIVIPLGKPLEVEVPVEYTFKAGTENINKTLYVKFRIDDLKVVHKPLKQFVGGSTTNKTSLFQAYRIELLRVLGEINSTPVALSIGVGLENNNYKFNDYE